MNDYWLKIKEWNKQNKTWFWGGIGGVIITLIITVAITVYSNSGKQKTSVSGSKKNTFNDLKSTSGDVNIITGDGNKINKTVIQGIPHQDYIRLAKELGVTENAVKNFFKIIKQKEVPKEDWDATLRQIAKRHKKFQSKYKALWENERIQKNIPTINHNKYKNNFPKLIQYVVKNEKNGEIIGKLSLGVEQLNKQYKLAVIKNMKCLYKNNDSMQSIFDNNINLTSNMLIQDYPKLILYETRAYPRTGSDNQKILYKYYNSDDIYQIDISNNYNVFDLSTSLLFFSNTLLYSTEIENYKFNFIFLKSFRLLEVKNISTNKQVSFKGKNYSSIELSIQTIAEEEVLKLFILKYKPDHYFPLKIVINLEKYLSLHARKMMF